MSSEYSTSPAGKYDPAAFGPPVTPGFRMAYFRSYQFIMDSPEWMTNVMWGFLCLFSTALIPVIGHLVFLGYLWECTETLHRTSGQRYPNFTLNQFVYYLQRSLWPFLVNLVAAIPVTFVMMIIVLAGIFALGLLAQAAGDFGPAIVAIGTLMLVLVMMVLTIGMVLVLTPLMIRAGLSQDFGMAFNFPWIKDFIRKVWLELLLATLFLMVTAIPLMFAGLLAFCIGMFATQAAVMLAQAHIQYQLYDLYLARGGEPILLKTPPPPPVTYVPTSGYMPPGSMSPGSPAGGMPPRGP